MPGSELDHTFQNLAAQVALAHLPNLETLEVVELALDHLPNLEIEVAEFGGVDTKNVEAKILGVAEFGGVDTKNVEVKTLGMAEFGGVDTELALLHLDQMQMRSL
jgi:hypothetical protein